MWPGLDDIVILQRLLQGHLPSLGEAKPDAPAELVRVCDRALAVAPANRYPSALHMRAELEAAITALGLELDGRLAPRRARPAARSAGAPSIARGEHALRLEAPGHQALLQQVSLEHDVTIELMLPRTAPTG